MPVNFGGNYILIEKVLKQNHNEIFIKKVFSYESEIGCRAYLISQDLKELNRKRQ